MAQRPPITDPNTLANVVTGLGGRVVGGRTFMVDVPLEEIKTFVPQVNDILNLGCRRVSERVTEHPTRIGNTQNVVTLELYRR